MLTMSKALRLVMEDVQSARCPSTAFNHLHPLLQEMSGGKPPCYAEFIRLSECLGKQSAPHCHEHYWLLMRCLYRQSRCGE